MHAGYASHVLGPLLVLAVGLGGVFVSTSVTVISGITARESGIASALLNVGRQLGGSLGIAVLGAVAGYALAFEIAAGIAFAGFVVALVTIRRRKVAVTPESEGIAA